MGTQRKEHGAWVSPHRRMAFEPDLKFHQAESKKNRMFQVRVQHKQRQGDVTIHQVGLVHRMLGRSKASKTGWARP